MFARLPCSILVCLRGDFLSVGVRHQCACEATIDHADLHGTPNEASELFNALTDAQFDCFQDDHLHIFTQVKTMLRQGLADFSDDDLADQG